VIHILYKFYSSLTVLNVLYMHCTVLDPTNCTVVSK